MGDAQCQLFWICTCVLVLLSQGEAAGESCTVQRVGSWGVCKSIHECAPVLADLQNNIKPTVCSRTQRTVCCVEPDISREKRISEIKCDEYSSSVTRVTEAISLSLDPQVITHTSPKCIQSSTKLIVGGVEANPGEFPHMVAVGFRSSEDEVHWGCGGTLISERFVLTAGHCSFSRQLGAEPSVCRLGGHNLARWESRALDMAVVETIIHPNYTLTNKYNDLALLRLASNVSFNDYIRPACLWQQAEIDEPKAVAIGWGNIGDSGEKSDVLMKVLLDIMQLSTCRDKVPPTKQIPYGIIQDQLCAGGGKNDTCKGDSGGPLTVTQKENSCVFYLLAVTSFGPKCERGFPGIYSRVSSFIPWIESQVWPDH